MSHSYKSTRFQVILFIACFLFTTIARAGEQLFVTAIAEDANSTWVGTHEGLWRLSKSSNTTEHYTVENSKLPSNYVNSIAVEADGNVWVGTANGILRYDRFTFYTLNTSNSSLPDNHITSIVVTATQHVVIGTF
jgi:ligand-binding sensor domain-containing protein